MKFLSIAVSSCLLAFSIGTIALPQPLKRWDTAKLRVTLPTTAATIKFSADGKTLLTSGAEQRSLALWNLTTGKQASILPVQANAVICDVALSADGQSAAAMMYFQKPNLPSEVKVEVWNLKTRHSAWTKSLGTQSPDQTIACQTQFSPNSRLLATRMNGALNSSQTGISLWNVQQATLAQRAVPTLKQIGTFAFSLDSSLLGATSPGATTPNQYSQVTLWNLKTQKIQAKLQAVEEGATPLSISNLVFTPDQQSVVAIADNFLMAYLRSWTLKTGRLNDATEIPHDHSYQLMKLSPDGQNYAAGGDVTGYQISNIRAKPGAGMAHGTNLMGRWSQVAFSPDGQQIAIIRADQPIIQIFR